MVLAYHKHEKAYVLRWTVRPGSSRCPGEKTPQVVSKDADAKTITADMFWASPVVRCRLLCFSDTSPGALEHACAMGPRGGRSFACRGCDEYVRIYVVGKAHHEKWQRRRPS